METAEDARCVRRLADSIDGGALQAVIKVYNT